MTRYYFHVDNGEHIEDPDGTELASLADARTQASRMLEEIVGQHVIDVWPDNGVRVTIADGDHLTLAILELSASTTVSAAGSGRR